MKEKDRNPNSESLGRFSEKSLLEQTLLIGQNGPLQLRKEERNQFLGEFRERVLKALTFAQIEEEGTYPEILAALKDSRAKKLIISRKADLSAAAEYIALAKEQNVSFTTVDSPDFKGEIGLVVVSDEAVDVPDISVENRKDRLQKIGIPEKLIAAVGKPICSDCMRLLQEKAPEEVKRYRLIGFWEKVAGQKCPACHGS